MSKSADIYGISVSPTHVGVVRLNPKTFAVEAQSHRTLPSATLSHDGKYLLDAPTLVSILKEIFAGIKHPQFTDPVYLSLYTPTGGTLSLAIPEAEKEALQKIREEIQHQVVLSEDDMPVIQQSLLWQHGQTASVVYSLLRADLIKDYCDAFYEIGVKIQAVDILPFSVLRALAASGVLDALLMKFGAKCAWGCYGVSGSMTWVTLWRGTNLLGMSHFPTPSTPETWSASIQQLVAQSEVTEVSLWLAWQEAGVDLPINPLKLNLDGAPIRPAVLSPLYGQTAKQPSVAALGAALKTEIGFPFSWDFLSDKPIEALKTDYKTIPYVNYQPILPKLIYRLALSGFMMVLLFSGYLIWQNRVLDAQQVAQRARIETIFKEINHKTQFCDDFLKTLKTTAPAGIQVQTIQLQKGNQLILIGKSYNKLLVQQFTKNLLADIPQTKIASQKLDIATKDGPPPEFDFTLTAQVDPINQGGTNP